MEELLSINNPLVPYLYRVAESIHWETSAIKRMDGTLPERWKDLSEEAQKSSFIVLSSIFLFFKESRNYKAISPEILHGVWMNQKESHGWSYGENYSLENKTHPSMISFDKLSYEDQQKDILWSAFFIMSFPHLLKSFSDCTEEFQRKFTNTFKQDYKIYDFLTMTV